MLELAAVQHDIAWESPTETMAMVRPLVLAAVESGARLVSLTEMWSCGFSMNTDVVAEAPDGPTATFMHDLAAETEGQGWRSASGKSLQQKRLTPYEY